MHRSSANVDYYQCHHLNLQIREFLTREIWMDDLTWEIGAARASQRTSGLRWKCSLSSFTSTCCSAPLSCSSPRKESPCDPRRRRCCDGWFCWNFSPLMNTVLIHHRAIRTGTLIIYCVSASSECCHLVIDSSTEVAVIKRKWKRI